MIRGFPCGSNEILERGETGVNFYIEYRRVCLNFPLKIILSKIKAGSQVNKKMMRKLLL